MAEARPLTPNRCSRRKRGKEGERVRLYSTRSEKTQSRKGISILTIERPAGRRESCGRDGRLPISLHVPSNPSMLSCLGRYTPTTMPRPRPLRNLASGSQYASEYSQITPRTPHSRAAGHGRDPQDMSQDDHNDFQSFSHQQSEPLLASSATDTFSDVNLRTPTLLRRNRGMGGQDIPTTLRQMPLLLGILLALVLLLLVILSWEQPDILRKAVLGTNYSGLATVNHSSPSNITLPLPPFEYVKVSLILFLLDSVFNPSSGMCENQCQTHVSRTILG